MKVGKVIEYIDTIKMNPYEDKIKTYWLNSLDGIIFKQVIKSDKPFIPYVWPEDEGKELLIKAPFDDIYWKYLCAMIDYANKEYDAYNNAMIFFNTAYEDMKRQYLKDHEPEVASRIEVEGGKENEITPFE